MLDDEKKHDYLKEIIKEEKGIMAAEFTASYMSEEDANWFRENSRFIGLRDYNSGMEKRKEKNLKHREKIIYYHDLIGGQ